MTTSLEPNLKAVLCLNGPLELQMMVCDVSRSKFRIKHRVFGDVWYEIRLSNLGPEGFVATTVNQW